MHEVRYLLCRPEAGLNDTLNQIELAYLYAAATDRKLIVDTNHVSSKHFRDDFGHYFASSDPRLVLSVDGYQDLFDTLDVHPPFLKGRVSDYQIEVSELQKCWVETETKVPVLIDYGINYSEPLLVHQSFGGGPRSIDALRKLTLQPWLIERLLERLHSIAAPYDAIHIRNTDLKTDYPAVLRQLVEVSPDRLFVATDSKAVIDAFKSELGDRVVTFTQPSLSDEPLHYQSTAPRQQNTEAILDLLLLCLSRKLYLAPLLNCPWARYSGFTLLAEALRANPAVLQGLLNTDKIKIN